MTLADLASKIQITASALSQNLKKPSFDTLEKLASALGVEVYRNYSPYGATFRHLSEIRKG